MGEVGVANTFAKSYEAPLFTILIWKCTLLFLHPQLRGVAAVICFLYLFKWLSFCCCTESMVFLYEKNLIKFYGMYLVILE